MRELRIITVRSQDNRYSERYCASDFWVIIAFAPNPR